MMQVFKRLVVCVAVLGAVAQQALASSIVYSHDDGSGESSLAFSGSQNLWLNSFTVVSGGEVITSIRIAFGANSNNDDPPNGTAMTAYLWTSASNNLDPTVDATVISTVAGAVQNIHTDTFMNFVLAAPVPLNVGDVFFAGFQAPSFAVARDTDSSAGQSWIFTDGGIAVLDPNTLGSQVFSGTFDSFGFPGNALIRVNAVPEPSSVVLFGLVGAGIAAMRWRRNQQMG